MSAYVKASKVPETVGTSEGTAKRNILRKSAPGKGRKDGIPGANLDDGSNDVDVYALDEHDPNFDSEDDSGNQNIPRCPSLHRDEVPRPAITLTQYKKRVMPIISEFFTSGDFENTAYYLQVSINSLF
jgi:hypothetical protein